MNRTAIALISGVVGGAVAATLAHLVAKKSGNASFAKRLDSRKWNILPIFLAIVVVTLSTFGTIYSSVGHGLRVAEGNAYSHAVQSDAVEESRIQGHQKSATKWLTWAESLREKGRSRALTVSICIVALFICGVTSLVMFTRGRWWIAPFLFAILVLIVSAASYAWSWHLPCDEDRLPEWRFLDMRLRRDPDLEAIMPRYPWLQAHLRNIEGCSATGGIYIQERDKCWDPGAREFYDLEQR